MAVVVVVVVGVDDVELVLGVGSAYDAAGSLVSVADPGLDDAEMAEVVRQLSAWASAGPADAYAAAEDDVGSAAPEAHADDGRQVPLAWEAPSGVDEAAARGVVAVAAGDLDGGRAVPCQLAWAWAGDVEVDDVAVADVQPSAWWVLDPAEAAAAVAGVVHQVDAVTYSQTAAEAVVARCAPASCRP